LEITKEVESKKIATSGTPSGFGNMIDVRKEVPKGSKPVVDLTNLDKVHIDTGASKGKVKLLDVAKEVKDHLKEISKEEPVKKKSLIVASLFSKTA
jgi:hypothetical protein